MPQVVANGLSENWLFKHCGDMHWQGICRALGMPSGAICDEAGGRLYPTFVAIALRSTRPLAHIQENDELDATIDLGNYGRSFFCSKVSVTGHDMVTRLEMITAFASRSTAGKNALRKSNPPVSIAYGCAELTEPPALLDQAKRLRKNDTADIFVLDRKVGADRTGLNLAAPYEPSPYIDFNGANLLYYAAYPTICDSMERLLVRKHGLADLNEDWCLETSTTARDVYYYRNLDIGDTVVVRINRFEPANAGFYLSTTLLSQRDGLPIADVFTLKARRRDPSGNEAWGRP